MIYVLDTDILTFLAHVDSPEAPRIRRRIAQLPSSDSVVTTIINYEEQMRGWLALLARVKSFRSQIDVYRRLLHHIAAFRRLAILPYDSAAAAISEQLAAERPRIGTMDLKIASIVLVSDATLISRNVADFRRIPDLRIDDWSTEHDAQ
jgi:tRNA(fMet)-specific endonuclease VapC